MSSHGYVEVADGRLFCVTAGAGPPLVMLHGAPTLDHRMWRREMAEWSNRYTVIAYDLRGYGQSSLPAGRYRHSDDLAAVLDAAGFESATLIGNSFGATVALDAALSRPGLADALVLAPLAPLPGWTWVEGFPLARALERAGSAPTREVTRAILDLPMNAAARERSEAMAALEEMAASYSGWHFTHRDPGRWACPDAVDRVASLDVPTLLVTGGRDVADVRMIADTFASAARSATHVTIESAGHSPNLDAPDEFDRCAVAFLARDGDGADG